MTAAPFSNATTSLEAAAAVVASGVEESQRAKVLRILEGVAGQGMTDAELAVVTGFGIRQVTARRRALVRAGLVADSGLVRLVPGVNGRPSIVWVRRDCPPEEPGKQTHGRIAAAVQRERDRVLEAVSDLLTFRGWGDDDVAQFVQRVRFRLT